jgi:hypothetical protein
MAHSTLMKYCTVMKLRTEADLPPAVAAAAERQRLKLSEWLRQKIREAVQAEGIELPPPGGGDDGPSPFRLDRGQRIAA